MQLRWVYGGIRALALPLPPSAGRGRTDYPNSEGRWMAIYPCDAHGARYRGPQRTMYPALINGTDEQRRKMRLCPECFAESAAWIAGHLDDAQDPEGGFACALCTKPEAPVAVFVTVYDRGVERADYFGRLCTGDCLATARVALFGAAGAA